MKTLIQIPFDGFYCSTTDGLLDMEIENHIEYRKEQNPDYGDYPDFTIDFHAIAKKYVSEYQTWLDKEHDIKLDLTFESLDMPREYNFRTDVIYCEVEDLEALYQAFLLDENSQKAINDRFKSRDGFISFYGDFVEDWKTKPLTEWDHNELAILLPEPESYYDVWENAQCNGFFDSVITYKDCVE